MLKPSEDSSRMASWTVMMNGVALGDARHRSGILMVKMGCCGNGVDDTETDDEERRTVLPHGALHI